MKHAAAGFALGLGLVCLSAQSQLVYRCGSVYSQAPCPQATIVDASDPRSATQQAEARQLALQQRQQAAEMVHDRRVREREQRPPQASGFDSRATPPAPSTSAHEPRKTRKKHSASAHSTESGADFTAIVPGSGKKPVRPPA
ncbi:MAG: hypothetical protein ABIP61_10595 [Burkholderiaceae bacterium]